MSAYDNRRSDDDDLCMGRPAADFTSDGARLGSAQCGNAARNSTAAGKTAGICDGKRFL